MKTEYKELGKAMKKKEVQRRQKKWRQIKKTPK
jgi:hypothetical protein